MLAYKLVIIMMIIAWRRKVESDNAIVPSCMCLLAKYLQNHVLTKRLENKNMICIPLRIDMP